MRLTRKSKSNKIRFSYNFFTMVFVHFIDFDIDFSKVRRLKFGLDFGLHNERTEHNFVLDWPFFKAYFLTLKAIKVADKKSR